ncbi:hypothetical protein KFL_002570170 [Klebsormidium nitens]|uniref:Uncharacterized protein n=1 Tax=Klebsormidium nitens TaxID=105231 RepID=A0A1Y1I8W2_KLENI|nr:hypothetical protein KFL_002570170 [Klebsormidium nitens]|eukprot:GAQ85849.1 hypothetical protein KFL_002570170 [Klebsormidium nitens]
MGRGLCMMPAPWEKERYQKEVQKRNRDREEQEKEKEAQAAKRQKQEIEEPEDSESEEEFHEESEEFLGSLDMGRMGGIWPHYIRLMFISGYRYVQSLDAAALPCDKQKILDAILKCCPSHKHKVKNIFERCCNNAFHALYMDTNKSGASSLFGGGFGGGFGRGEFGLEGLFDTHNMFDEASVMDGSTRMYLGVAGLDPIAELALVRQRDLPPLVVRRAAAMLKSLKPFVPQTAADLAETPYDAADEDSVDENGCVQLLKQFIPLFEKAADFGDCIAEQS